MRMIREKAPAARNHRRGASSLGVWLGVWAIVISLICLYLAIDARAVAADAERRLERNVTLLDQSRERIEELDRSVRENIDLSEQQLEELSFAVRRNESRLETNTRQLESTREVASQLIDGLSTQKEAITELATRIPAIPSDVLTERTTPEPERTTAGNEAPAPSDAAPTDAPGSESERAPATYTVRSGDTLVDIARRKKLSVPDLLDANPDIDPNVIRVGQKLNLPR
ncbi:MAG: LysM peptidoglycan-binding domain-containing protein [Puniceicoccaceae bacterium]